MKPYLLCPTCGCEQSMKNGRTRGGKQNYKCQDCGRQFRENPQWQPMSPESKATSEWLLHELMPLAGIARTIDVEE